MITLHRTQEYNFEWKIVDSDWVLADPDTVRWRIYSDIAGTLTQIEPGAGWNTLVLVTQRVRTGVYNIPWTVPADAEEGQWWLEVEVTQGTTVETFIDEFEIIGSRIIEIDSRVNGIHFAPLWRLRTLYTSFTDKALYRAVLMASQAIEQYCGYSFVIRQAAQVVPCTYNGKLDLPQPVAILESVVDDDSTVLEIDCPLARHLRYPNVDIALDDRLTPLLEISVYKNNNYTINAWMGYTDFGGAPWGKTPDMIQSACVRLATVVLDGIEDPGEVTSGNISDEKTASQSVEYQDLPDSLYMAINSSVITGDAVLYQMLKPYMRANKISLV